MSNVHTLQSISQTTTQRRLAEQANPIRQRAAQTNALAVAIAGTTAVNYVQNLAQQNRNNIDIVVEDLTEEAVDRVIAANPGVNINTTLAVENGREWANETVDNLNGQNVEQPQEDIDRARRGIVNTFPRTAAVSQDAETITSVSGGKKCNCTAQKTLCAVLAVFLLVFGIAVYHSVHTQLDPIVRKPGEEKKDDDPEAPADK